MRIQGTHDEVLYFNMQCMKMKDCSGCPLLPWCTRRGNKGNVSSGFAIIETQSKYSMEQRTVFIGKEDNGKSIESNR